MTDDQILDVLQLDGVKNSLIHLDLLSSHNPAYIIPDAILDFLTLFPEDADSPPSLPKLEKIVFAMEPSSQSLMVERMVKSRCLSPPSQFKFSAAKLISIDMLVVLPKITDIRFEPCRIDRLKTELEAGN